MSERTREISQWEVRSPLVYGSHHEGFFDTEADALKFAHEWMNTHGGEKLHRVDQIIYIQDENE